MTEHYSSWRKSALSSASDDNCVEVATVTDTEATPRTD
jgi:hypothetical protein